jgi:hypothetical protein
MGLVVNLIITLAVVVASLATGSLAWPRFTTQERPKLLQEVHDVALKTPIGREAASVLGVTDESQVEPFNFGSIIYSIVDSARAAAQNRAQTVIVGNAVNQLKGQFDQLSSDQKDLIRQAICQPLDSESVSSPSATE